MSVLRVAAANSVYHLSCTQSGSIAYRLAIADFTPNRLNLAELKARVQRIDACQKESCLNKFVRVKKENSTRASC